MPTILRANAEDQVSIEYQRIQLTQYFLDWSLKYSELSKGSYGNSFEEEIEYSIISILNAALFVDSFINQMAEEFIDDKDSRDFDRCRKEYKNTSNLTNTTWKLFIILNKQGESNIEVGDKLLNDINRIILSRHKLVHYKPEEASRKIHRKAPKSEGMFTLDFMSKPLKVEPSLIEKELCCLKAIEHYMTCRELLLLWCNLIKQEVGDFSRFPVVELPEKINLDI